MVSNEIVAGSVWVPARQVCLGNPRLKTGYVTARPGGSVTKSRSAERDCRRKVQVGVLDLLSPQSGLCPLCWHPPAVRRN
jgi:hypothetical protein